MKRFPLIAATTAVGLALLGGSLHAVRASATSTVPLDGVKCYYKLWHCSYDGPGYWDGCDPNYPEGYITTGMARSICQMYYDD